MFKTQKFAKLFYIVSVAISLALFVYNSIELFIEYGEEKTGFNQIEHPMEAMEFPAVTICATELFKNVDDETNADEILQNLKNHTFPLSEIFPTWPKLRACQGCVVQETFSYINGLCYTVSTAVKQVKGLGMPVLYLLLNKSHKYQVISTD